MDEPRLVDIDTQMLFKKPEEDDAEDVTSVTAALQYVARPSLQP